MSLVPPLTRTMPSVNRSFRSSVKFLAPEPSCIDSTVRWPSSSTFNSATPRTMRGLTGVVPSNSQLSSAAA